MQCLHRRIGFLNETITKTITKYDKDCFKRATKGIKINKTCLLHLGIGSHFDPSTKIFGGYDGQ